MRLKYLILLLFFFIVGCITPSKIRIPRQPINKIEAENNKAEIIKTQIKKPQIRKPQIKWRNKKMDEKEMKDKWHDIYNQPEQNVKVEGENKKAEIKKAQSHKTISEAERGKRFDNLLAESSEIKEDKGSLFDKIFVWIGALGVCAVFWTGVYFVAKNLK